MIGATTHGKGSTSRIRAKRLYDANFDGIKWPSKHISNKSISSGLTEDGTRTCLVLDEQGMRIETRPVTQSDTRSSNGRTQET